MSKIVPFRNKAEEEWQLRLMDPEEFDRFLLQHIDEPTLKNLILRYRKEYEDVQAAIARNSMLLTNELISEQKARQNLQRHFQTLERTSELKLKIIRTYLYEKSPVR